VQPQASSRRSEAGAIVALSQAGSRSPGATPIRHGLRSVYPPTCIARSLSAKRENIPVSKLVREILQRYVDEQAA